MCGLADLGFWLKSQTIPEKKKESSVLEFFEKGRS
jgi:hypothetical protein